MQRLLLFALALALAGCLDTQEPLSPSADSGATPSVAAPIGHAVVAVIDSAIDPYHQHFQRGKDLSDDLLATFVDDQGRPPLRIELAINGSYEERREADAAIWDNIESGRIHYFANTTILGVSFGGNIIGGGGHGTGTSGAVLDVNPDAIIMFVHGTGSATSEAFAAATPWVDILSESYGLYCGQPVLSYTGQNTATNNRDAHGNGKLPVGAADNTPCPAPSDGTSGPPWVLGVAGDHPNGQSGCREVVSGNFPDVTSDFTQELPIAGTLDEYRNMSGTSFATPMTAGTASLILQQVRTAWEHTGGIEDGAMATRPDGSAFTNDDLRDVIQQSAYYFSTELECGAGTVNSQAPWLQMGWGHVGPEIVDTAVAHLVDGTPIPPHDPEAEAYMDAWMEYRRAAWAPIA